MITRDGKNYNTISDAAKRLHVSVKTVNTWIKESLLPRPPVVDYGTREMPYFPDDYIRDALAAVAEKRRQRRETRRQRFKKQRRIPDA